MKKKTTLFILIFIVLAGLIWYWSFEDYQNKNKNEAEGENIKNVNELNKDAPIVLFYGEDCPHCKDVEEFLEENNIKEKVSFSNLEVWYNDENRDFLLEKAEECGYSQDELGVPFLYARGQCFSGAPDIEAFFSKEAGI